MDPLKMTGNFYVWSRVYSGEGPAGETGLVDSFTNRDVTRVRLGVLYTRVSTSYTKKKWKRKKSCRSGYDRVLYEKLSYFFHHLYTDT